jgi:hypothetical protein
MGWTYSGSGSRDEDSQGDEAKVRREMASISGERMPWSDKWEVATTGCECGSRRLRNVALDAVVRRQPT